MWCKVLGRSFFPVVILLLSVLLIAPPPMIQAQGPVPDGVVLWNKLDNAEEVQNSEVGQDFAMSGVVTFIPGQYDSGIATEGECSYLSMSPDDFFPSDKTRGTVEVWIQKRMQQLIPYQTPLVGIFGYHPYGNNYCGGVGYNTIAAYWSDGFQGGGGVQFQILGSNSQWLSINDLGWDNVPVGQWVHMAFVWNLDGINGPGTETLRIYRDGDVVASTTETVPGIYANNSQVRILGHHAYSRFGQPTAYLDNIKVWDYAKTDFSDRFIEGFNQPPTANAGGPYVVAEGGSIQLDGSDSSDVEQDANSLSYAWDFDGDGQYDDATGSDPIFSAATLDGPDSVMVGLKVTDDGDLTDMASADITINNADPIISVVNNDGPILKGSNATITVIASDPAGVNDPLSYEFDCDNDGIYEVGPQADNTTACFSDMVGSFTVNVRVTDGDGGQATNSTTVAVEYDFNGFFAPINNLPTVNSAKAGRAIPVKFSLNGDQGLNIFAAGYPASQEIVCDGSTSVAEIEETDTAGNSSLNYDSDSDTYNYVWKTDKDWKNTCRQLIVRLDDGKGYIVQFEFK